VCEAQRIRPPETDYAPEITHLQTKAKAMGYRIVLREASATIHA